MPTEGVKVQPDNILHKTDPQGIQTNIAHQLPQVGALLALNRFIAVLEQLAGL